MGFFILFVILSTILMLLGIKFWQKRSFLLDHGKIADAIIFKNNVKGFDDYESLHYPVVQFLTDKKEWISQELDIGHNPPLKLGRKVKVLYDPDDPHYVVLKSSFRLIILPRLMVICGLFGIIIGLLAYAEIIEL